MSMMTTGAAIRIPAMAGRTVAVPSERSTAYLLFRLWAADTLDGGVGEIVVLPFHEIMPAVRDGKVDAGLVIHEARFTYQNYGLHKRADMGEHWEETSGLPIPLGAIIAKRSLGRQTLTTLADTIRASVRAAWDDPEASRPWFRRLADLGAELAARPEWTGFPGRLSMGMSDDFEVAIEEGATHVRVGTLLFGPRDQGA